jgi:anti-sigma B factor antagonist
VEAASDTVSGAPALWLKVGQAGDHRLIEVGGELDLATVDEFAAGVRGELVGGGVVLDLSGVSFLDSSGVRALDELVVDVDREGWVLEIRWDLQRAVRQVLEITGMIELLPMAGGRSADGGAG